ncbi:MAG: DEAD/DEAH box helicase family protein [Candidatus Eisenbacteria bacterium]|nr:DEAD/DEAH box helicase family protein [Candidatus Eisenbacteria bacterium]
MELKEYQQKALSQVKRYLEALGRWRTKNEQVVKVAGAEASLDVPLKAWEEVVGAGYRSRKNGLGEYVANFCLKIPTGGGKTLLAVKAIDLINSIYRKKQTGLVLWVVPTTQIYRQTIQHLRNREHPYRQHLDIASGDRTLVLEKLDRFTPIDLAQNLVVMMLMLPSASRQNKETLKVFKDSGGFGAFFPSDDDIEGHKKLLDQFSNLDAFDDRRGFFGRQVKTSLGNTLRLLSPVIILDEGHKAYSETAQGTLRGFNPSIIVELSATPTPASNILVDIRGMELAREEMVKLDLHIINKVSVDWKDTMLSSVERRNVLEEKTKEYRANTGEYIRPICLVQVERTGKDQRGGRYIHAEDVREYLIKVCGIPEEQVAVKTSEKDDIEGIDLLARDCPIRYIITKQALQEGWDCAFAYVLTILTNPASKNNLTQLVGRILRQPFARKTKSKELDESYVFCFQQRGAGLLASVKAGFEQEGLGDLAGRVIADETLEGEVSGEGERVVEIRDEFRKFVGKIYLPVFVIQEDSQWRQVSYEMDIISRIDWTNADFSSLYELPLSPLEEKDIEVAIGLSEDEKEVIRQKGVVRLKEGGLAIDMVFVARHLVDIIPNPWVAHEIGTRVMERLLAKSNAQVAANNLVFIIEETRKHAEKEKDRLAQQVFSQLIHDKRLRFLLLKEDQGYRLPSRIRVRRTGKTLTRSDGLSLQRSLFEFVPDDELNSTETAVAWYLEEQGRLLWWYRNLSRQDYAIQGWRKHRIYPDFIFSEVDPKDWTEYDKVFVVETKGLHLKNEDTEYKQDVFELCNRLAEAKSWLELGLQFPEKKVVFQVVFEHEWQRKINTLFAP